jgi:hypothetical protein
MLFILLLVAAITVACLRQKPGSIPEDIEWTWEVRPPHPNPQLPNVLLLGDSISRNYFPQVTKDLAGIANVYLMASSTSVGDPRLPHQIAEFAALEKVGFRVLHFNNGLHGWGYSEAQFQAAFPAFLNTVHDLVGQARNSNMGNDHSGEAGLEQWSNQSPHRTEKCDCTVSGECCGNRCRRSARAHDRPSRPL